MGKLHQLIAVEPDLHGSCVTILNESETLFSKKPNLFFGSIKKLEMFDEEDKTPYADEHVELTTTVLTRLEYQRKFIAKYFDALLQKESTNQLATSDLIVNGKTIAVDLPATFLLGLEKRLAGLRNLYKSIPTLPQGVKWEIDESQGIDIYKAVHPEVKFKTRRTFNSKVLYEATEHHPAQIEKWDESVNVGQFVTDKWCGMVSSAAKSAMLKRLDDLIVAVKKARQKANDCKVVERNIGEDIMKYIELG